MKNELIEAGIIVNTHSRHGQVKLQTWADTPDFLTGFKYFYIDGEPVKVLSAKVHKTCVIAEIDGVIDIDSAIKMKNKIISVKKEDIQLEEGRYFITDLIGLSVFDVDTGKEIGKISDVLSLPSNEVYVINGEREILVPAVPEFVIETNIKEGFVKIRFIEGL